MSAADAAALEAAVHRMEAAMLEFGQGLHDYLTRLDIVSRALPNETRQREIDSKHRQRRAVPPPGPAGCALECQAVLDSGAIARHARSELG